MGNTNDHGEIAAVFFDLGGSLGTATVGGQPPRLIRFDVFPFIPPGVLADLQAKGLRLGVISNTGGEKAPAMNAVLQPTGLLARFDAMHCSGHIHRHKLPYFERRGRYWSPSGTSQGLLPLLLGNFSWQFYRLCLWIRLRLRNRIHCCRALQFDSEAQEWVMGPSTSVKASRQLLIGLDVGQ